MRTKENTEQFIFRISKSLRKRYKIYCATNEYGMSERLRKLMELDLKDNLKC